MWGQFIVNDCFIRQQSNIQSVTRCVAFPVTGYDEVFSGYQLGQMVERWKNQHFEDHLCPRPQGTSLIMVGKNILSKFIPGPVCLRDRSVGGFNSCFCLDQCRVWTTLLRAERDRTLPFLDVLVSRRLDGTLGHTVYRKLTRTDLYLHAKSEHHPAQKRAVLTTLIRRAKTLCDPNSLGKEIQRLRDNFQRNGHNKNEIRRALHPKRKPEPKNNKPASIAVLPYQQAVSNKISRLLTKYCSEPPKTT
jgi:hypothetical protein